MKLRAAGLGLVLAVTFGATAACGDPVDPCQVNPTRTAANGEWVEADGEPLDSDPCDSDDVNKSKSKKKKKVNR